MDREFYARSSSGVVFDRDLLWHCFAKEYLSPQDQRRDPMAQRIPFGFENGSCGSMGEEVFLVAIPVFRARVAPVLDWCSTIHLFSEVSGSESPVQELFLIHASAFDRMRILRANGVQTLICGVLSPDLLHYGRKLGIRIIHGVAGEVPEVLRAYLGQKLDHPRFRLPGCKGPRNYRRRCKRVCDGDATAEPSSDLGERKVSWGRGRKGRGNPLRKATTREGVSAGPGGFCVCPECGARVPHQNGIPCVQIACPACGRSMVRG